MRARSDAAGEVLQALEEVGFGLDQRYGRDQILGFGDRFGQRCREHWFGCLRGSTVERTGQDTALRLERVLVRVNARWAPSRSISVPVGYNSAMPAHESPGRTSPPT